MRHDMSMNESCPMSTAVAWASCWWLKESRHLCERVMSHVNGTCHEYERVMSHVYYYSLIVVFMTIEEVMSQNLLQIEGLRQVAVSFVNTYIDISIYIYVATYECVSACVCAFVCVCMYTYNTYTHSWKICCRYKTTRDGTIRMYTHIYIYICIHICQYIWMCVCGCVFVCVCVFI